GHPSSRRPDRLCPRRRTRRPPPRRLHNEAAPIGNFDRLKVLKKWPMTLFNNYFSAPDHNRKRFRDIGF
ncbi:hypothetical protein SB816_33060, partial [Achromobacter sp. SIMBA_011]|uniref:hypothetical protein n=1 Tax=Achromobacter sp. SIMBA_011 TaxID=3085759 RepID=UPI00397B29B9